MKENKSFKYLAIALFIVFVISFSALIIGYWLEANVAVVGIRIAVLIVSFASFGASTLFSMMVYNHNKTVSKINDDLNKRSELFRELQFASSNYSIIEYNDRMLISPESERYIPRFHKKDDPSFHLVYENLDLEKELSFYTIRIPFKVIEGKTCGRIELSEIKFEKDSEVFNFIPMEHEKRTRAYLLYNEQTKRSNMIVNIVTNSSSNFFKDKVNIFSKIKITLTISSILGVSIKGRSELYFTNPTQIEGDGLHTYKINSSNFLTSSPPYLEEKFINESVPYEIKR